MQFIKPQKARKLKPKEINENGEPVLPSNWISERKYRGHRILATKDTCWSSIGTSKSIPFLSSVIPDGMMLDGELITRNPHCVEGDVTTAIAYNHDALIFTVFDILRYCSEDVTGQPLFQRRIWVEKIVDELACDRIVKSEICDSDHMAFFNRIIDEGGEGVIFKDRRAEYKPGSRAAMIKFKPEVEIDVVVVDAEGYPTKGSSQWEKGYRNLRYGLHDEDDGELRVLGSLGFTKPYEDLQKYIGRVVAVTCVGQFPSGCVNHIIKQRFRYDKLPVECTFNFSTGQSTQQ